MTPKTRVPGVNVTRTSQVEAVPCPQLLDGLTAGTKGTGNVPAPGLVTPCYGRSDLFDSQEIWDHREAKALCMTCPTLAACKLHLQAVKKSAGPYGQPEGTWAGQLLETTKRRIAREDAAYSDQDAAEAHNAFNRGEQDDWTVIGERVYQRRRPRNRKKVA